MSESEKKKFKTKFVEWDWKAWQPTFNGKPLEVGQRHTARRWDFEASKPIWVVVDVVSDKYGKMWFGEVETGKLWDLQDMPLLVAESE